MVHLTPDHLEYVHRSIAAHQRILTHGGRIKHADLEAGLDLPISMRASLRSATDRVIHDMRDPEEPNWSPAHAAFVEALAGLTDEMETLKKLAYKLNPDLKR